MNGNNTRKNQMGGFTSTVGSKAAVYHGTAKHTSGGLKKKDLMKTKNGRIVSRRKHAAGKKAIQRLRKLGYIAKKGTFKLFHKGRKHRGGSDAAAGFAGAAGSASVPDLSKLMEAVGAAIPKTDPK
jgi:hypothetical protein